MLAIADADLHRFLANLLATVSYLCTVPSRPQLNTCQTFMLLDLNPVMSIIANVPAAIASTVSLHAPSIAASLTITPEDRGLSRCASAIELHDPGRRDLWVCPPFVAPYAPLLTPSSSSVGSTMAFSRGRSRVPPTVEIPDKKGIESSGVHVQVSAQPKSCDWNAPADSL